MRLLKHQRSATFLLAAPECSTRNRHRRTRLAQVLDLLREDSWRSVYAGELEVRPPGAPTLQTSVARAKAPPVRSVGRRRLVSQVCSGWARSLACSRSMRAVAKSYCGSFRNRSAPLLVPQCDDGVETRCSPRRQPARQRTHDNEHDDGAEKRQHITRLEVEKERRDELRRP